MIDIYNNLINEIDKIKNIELAKHHERFFQTQKGGYAENDKFIGLTVPQVRVFVKRYYKIINFKDLKLLIKNKYHEIRLFAILCLVEKYLKLKDKENNKEQDEIVKFYLNNTKYINNWDLVDLSCYKILGNYCFNKNRGDIIYKLSKSNNLWEQRISIISTMYFIKNNSFNITIDLCKYFLVNKHHLIQKACGWMLREIGKKDENILLNFLKIYGNEMPRIMYSYAIEKIKDKL